jgi:hypothetical protein
MGFQSGTILIILMYVTFLPWMEENHHTTLKLAARYLRDFGIWGTIAITLYSGLAYIKRAAALFSGDPEKVAS